jgi:hypothetical protein
MFLAIPADWIGKKYSVLADVFKQTGGPITEGKQPTVPWRARDNGGSPGRG